MEIDWYYRAAILIFCFILSAFFSGSEVALFTLDKSKINELKSNNPVLGGYIISLLEFPRRLLVTILIGNTIVNVAAVIISVTFALEFAYLYNVSQNIAIAFQIALITILILLFGEISPKIFASKHPVAFSKIVSFPLYWTSILVYPISIILTDLLKLIFNKIRTKSIRKGILNNELKDLVSLGTEKGSIEKEKQGLIHGLVSFKKVSAREVMTPRVDIVAVSIDTDFEELVKIITESMHSRIPLYKDDLDEIVGILYAKDLLPFLKNGRKKENLDLSKIARKAIFVPETKLISDLMREFQEKKMHVGIVVDEYGGTAGLISLEDILEEIVGDIRDEYDQDINEIIKLEDNSLMVMGKVTIEEINEILGIDLNTEDDDYDTIGGFILNNSGEIPVEGYSFVYRNFRFTVKEVTNKRVQKILIEPVAENKLEEKS